MATESPDEFDRPHGGSPPPARLRLVVSALAGLLLCSSCGAPVIEFREVKRIDEKVTEAELETFLGVIEALPDGKLPALPAVYMPPPKWDETRTLSVAELINEERNVLAEHWSVDWLARKLNGNRRLSRALREHSLTTEQFLGLTLAIGAALSRTTLHDDQDLGQLLEQGNRTLQVLRENHRPFNSLTPESMYYVLRQAVWLTRVDRVQRLSLVPPENVALVRTHRERLLAVFPEEFTTNPLDAIADRLEESGVPFEVTDPRLDDTHLSWDPEDVVFGTDAPPRG